MMEGWKEVRFGDVVEFPPKVKMVKDLSYPFIPMELIDSGFKYVKPIAERKLHGGGAKFEEGDTLFARITPCLQNGKIAQAKDLGGKPAFGSTEYFVFRGKDGFTKSEFVYYLSKTRDFQENAINSMVGASGRQRADAGHVKKFIFNLPPLHTQQKIASILSAYDDLIENNLKRIKLLEEMAQQTYEEWFVRMRFPGYQNAVMNKETGLPEGWALLKLVELYDLKYGKNLRQTEILKVGQYNVYGASGKMGYYSKKNISEKKVLVTSRGNGSGVVHRTYETESFITNNSFVVNTKLGLGYTFYNLLHFDLSRFNSGSAQPQLTNSALNNVEMVLPKSELIAQFNVVSDTQIEIIDNLILQNQRLKEARDILLPRLMSGMIEV